jgi:hypothetical protein
MLTAVKAPRIAPCFNSARRIRNGEHRVTSNTVKAARPKRAAREAADPLMDPAEGARKACSVPKAFIIGMQTPQRQEAVNNMIGGSFDRAGTPEI